MADSYTVGIALFVIGFGCAGAAEYIGNVNVAFWLGAFSVGISTFLVRRG